MHKIDNKDTRTTSTCFSVYIAEFKDVKEQWVEDSIIIILIIIIITAIKTFL